MPVKYEKPLLKPFRFDGPQIGYGANCNKPGNQANTKCTPGAQATGSGCTAGNQAAFACGTGNTPTS